MNRQPTDAEYRQAAVAFATAICHDDLYSAWTLFEKYPEPEALAVTVATLLVQVADHDHTEHRTPHDAAEVLRHIGLAAGRVAEGLQTVPDDEET